MPYNLTNYWFYCLLLLNRWIISMSSCAESTSVPTHHHSRVDLLKFMSWHLLYLYYLYIETMAKYTHKSFAHFCQTIIKMLISKYHIWCLGYYMRENSLNKIYIYISCGQEECGINKLKIWWINNALKILIWK